MLFTATVVLTTACSKNKTDNPPPPAASPAEGYWVGKYTTNGAIGFDNYAMLIKAGGAVRIYDMGAKTDTSSISALAKTDGVWTLNGAVVQTSYANAVSSKTINTTAVLNAAKTQMTGNWSLDGVVKGSIDLSK